MTKKEYIKKYLDQVYDEDLKRDILTYKKMYYVSLPSLAEDENNTRDLVSLLSEYDIEFLSSLGPHENAGKYPPVNIGYSKTNDAWYIWDLKLNIYKFEKGDSIDTYDHISWKPNSREDHMKGMLAIMEKNNPDAIVLIENMTDDSFDIAIMEKPREGQMSGFTVNNTSYYTVKFLDDNVYAENKSVGFEAVETSDARIMAIQAWENIQ